MQQTSNKRTKYKDKNRQLKSVCQVFNIIIPNKEFYFDWRFVA